MVKFIMEPWLLQGRRSKAVGLLFCRTKMVLKEGRLGPMNEWEKYLITGAAMHKLEQKAPRGKKIIDSKAVHHVWA